MAPTGRFIWAVGLAAALAVMAAAGAISVGDEAALLMNELLRVEPVPSDPTSPVDDHLRYLIEIDSGEREFTEADIAERFTSELRASTPPAEILNAIWETARASSGSARFVRVLERDGGLVHAREVNQDGTPQSLVIQVTENGRVQYMNSLPDPTGLRRLSGWESVLVVVGGWGLVVGGVVAWRSRAPVEGWLLLAASVPAFAVLLVLSDAGLVYTVGRVVPGLVVVLAVALLAGLGGGRSRWLLVVAGASAVVGGLAPFVRDASLIGHPGVVGAFADSEGWYRGLLAGSAGLVFVAMAGVAVGSVGGVGRVSGQLRPAVLVGAVVAGLWAVAGLGSAFDYGLGDGRWLMGRSGSSRCLPWLSSPPPSPSD